MHGCKNIAAPDEHCYFTKMDAAETGISFNNKITESDSVNVFTNEYMYNGSGVAVGDFNKDGLPDLVFCGSMVSCKLYLNTGSFHFNDITERAGLQTNEWCTGASVVDINNDGFPDIYICASHATDASKRKNLLFINNGFIAGSKTEIAFTEQAAAYGLADTGYATQAAFLDYDKDGDLDMYLLNHRLYSHTANNIELKDTSGNSPAQDRLYRNEGIAPGTTHPVFKDVSAVAGIKEDAYGLGLVITDVNNDNWPDIYVANDYIGNDEMWLNNKNGTFSNIIATAVKHQSYNSMGTDAADINNDGLPDIAVVDMLPESSERKKMMANATTQEKFDMQQRFGYQPSYVRNMLQLNNGNRKQGTASHPFYSEIAQYAGMAETDWSWSVLMADFDNDGWKDIHITNGLGRDVTNNDYTAFRNAESNTNNYTFGNGKEQQQLVKKDLASLRENIDKYGSVKMINYFFHNNGDLTFSNKTKAAGLSVPSISNGAAYVDLDNDGDLDLVVNNLDEEAFVWRNEVRKTVADSTANFITVALQGDAGNTEGFGARVTLFSKQNLQFAEQAPVRGFSSGVDLRLHFGVGNATIIDSLKIIWPDDKVQVVKNIKVNQQLELLHSNALSAPAVSNYSKALFADYKDTSISFKHTESQNFDFGYHQPLPQKYSQLGPCMATGDVNGDGLTDFFVGGAANQPGKIFIQQANGTFVSANLQEGGKPGEDLGAVFFDADGDKDADLLVTGGSFEFSSLKNNQPRLYTNNGKGQFTLAAESLPEITVITDAVSVTDYDGDGDMDIFMGGRLLPQKYPESPRSYLLQNNGGKFTDVTRAVCPALEFAGMITATLFTDFDNDKKPDLIICGEWTTVRFFKNVNNGFKEVTEATGLENMHGLWRSLQQADIDNDGDMDYIAGNMGLNNIYHIAAERPMTLFAKDVDKNGFAELIPANYMLDRDGGYQLFPALDRNQLAEQLPSVKKKYLLHADYAKVTMEQLMNNYGGEGWTKMKCEQTASVWLENIGQGKFKMHILPAAAQFAPVNCIVASDVNGDGNLDLIIAGNEYQTAVNTGRYDASYGLLLLANGKGDFVSVNPVKSGLIEDGDIKDMAIISLVNKKKLLIAVPNDGHLKTFVLHSAETKNE